VHSGICGVPVALGHLWQPQGQHPLRGHELARVNDRRPPRA